MISTRDSYTRRQQETRNHSPTTIIKIKIYKITTRCRGRYRTRRHREGTDAAGESKTRHRCSSSRTRPSATRRGTRACLQSGDIAQRSQALTYYYVETLRPHYPPNSNSFFFFIHLRSVSFASERCVKRKHSHVMGRRRLKSGKKTRTHTQEGKSTPPRSLLSPCVCVELEEKFPEKFQRTAQPSLPAASSGFVPSESFRTHLFAPRRTALASPVAVLIFTFFYFFRFVFLPASGRIHTEAFAKKGKKK